MRSIDALAWPGNELEKEDADLLREVVRCLAEELMGTQAGNASLPEPGDPLGQRVGETAGKLAL